MRDLSYDQPLYVLRFVHQRWFSAPDRFGPLMLARVAAIRSPTAQGPGSIITGRDDRDWRGATPFHTQVPGCDRYFETRIAEEFRNAGS
jgi:hypothetical protein